MMVEYGKLKMFLVGTLGLLSPFQGPMAELVPSWLKFSAMCVQGAAAALLAYLLKPPASSDDNNASEA